MSTPSITERVAAGVAWLDNNRPGWVGDINVERLDLSSCLRCVLGQLFGEFHDAPYEVLAADTAPALGFDRYSVAVDADASDQDYADLTAEWRRVVEERRTQAAGATS